MNQTHDEMTIKIPTPDAPSPEKKRSALPLIIISILLSTVILSAAVAAGILLIPVMRSDQWTNTVDRVFFDTAALEVFSEALAQGSQASVSLALDAETSGLLNDVNLKLTAAGKEKNGEITLSLRGGSSELLLSMIYSEESIAIAVYDPADKTKDIKYLSLPRTGLAEEFKNSLFAPDSGSDYALDEDIYNEILSLLESLEGAEKELDQEALNESIRNITDEIANIIEPNVSLRFAEGEFALCRDVSIVITPDNFSRIIDIVIAEAEESEALTDWLNSAYGEALGTENGPIDALRSLKDELPEGNIILEWTVIGNYVSQCRLAYEDVADGFEAIVNFTYGKEANRAELTFTVGGEGAKLVYEKTDDGDELVCTLTVEIDGETVESKVSHDKTSGALTITATGSDSLESYFEIRGNCKYDSTASDFSLSFDSVKIGTAEAIKGFELAIEISKLEREIAIPSATPLLGMTGDELTAFIDSLPYMTLNNILTKCFGEGIDSYLSADGKLLLGAARYSEAVNLYANAYSIYLADPEPLRADYISVHLPEFGIYLLLEYDSLQNMILYNFAYELTDELAMRYHPAALGEDGYLKVHSITSSHTAPTCLNDGFTVYSCDICEDVVRVGEPQLYHSYVQKELRVTADDGSTHNATYSYCESCNAIFVFEITGRLGMSFDYKLSSDTYSLTRYDVYSAFDGVFGIPTEFEKLMRIDDICTTDLSGIVCARIPYGMKRLSKYDLINTESLQILILPNTLTEITADAIPASDRLHTIFFIGTADEFSRISLGDLAGIIDGINVIYAPDGVTPDMIKKEIYDIAKVDAALAAAKAKVQKSIAAAKEAAKTDGVTLLYSGKIENILYDEISSRIGIWYALSDSESLVTIYNVNTGSVERELKVGGKITHFYIREGYVAYTLDGSFEVYVYEIATDKTVSFSALRYYEFSEDSLSCVFIHGGKVYTATSEQHCYITYYDIATGKVDRFQWTIYTPDFYINHEQNKLISLCLEQSPEAVVVYDLTTNTQILEFHLDRLAFDATYMGDYIIDNRGNVYDLNGKPLSSIPKESAPVAAPHTKDMMTVECLSSDAIGSFSIAVDKDYNVSSVIAPTDGAPLILDIYAEVAIATENGDFLIYAPGGYGLLFIDMK